MKLRLNKSFYNKETTERHITDYFEGYVKYFTATLYLDDDKDGWRISDIGGYLSFESVDEKIYWNWKM